MSICTGNVHREVKSTQLNVQMRAFVFAAAFRTVERFETRFHNQPPSCNRIAPVRKTDAFTLDGCKFKLSGGERCTPLTGFAGPAPATP
jgi:hypothetical protein